MAKKSNNKKKGYKPTYQKLVKPVAPADYKVGTYQSKYGPQLESARSRIINWKYNPLEDASYQALAKIYGARGNIAAKDTLADAAALNGGYQTSYAVSAAQQARNQYNQELAAMIPDLEASAYQRAQGALGALTDADATDYGRFRDAEGDRQWLFSQNYQRYQDALSNYQWALDYNNSLYAQKQAEAAAKRGGGGGGGRRSGGSGGYMGGTTGDSGYTGPTKENTGDADMRIITKNVNKDTGEKNNKNTSLITVKYPKKGGGGRIVI